MATRTATSSSAVETGMAFIASLFSSIPAKGIAFRFWDGSVWQKDPDDAPTVTIVLNHPGALRKMFFNPSDLTLGEAYIYNDFDIEGDIFAVFPIMDDLLAHYADRMEQLRLARHLLALPRTASEQAKKRAHFQGQLHSKSRDRQAISYHYDRSNAFYAQFLDQRMVYSCAYFPTPEATLDEAQENKLDYICRKLRLRPGETLLDIGCGWGGLVMHAVQHYGVQALGITLSERQAEYAQSHIQAAGLRDRCSVEIRDYRDVRAPEGGYDKLVSVGMFEHVGAKKLPGYFEQAFKLLRPSGVFLNHGIASNGQSPGFSADSFAGTYVFPDGELVPIHTTLAAAESGGFEVRDVESLREHYALTLQHWVRNLEAHAQEARTATDEVTYRIWRLYMAGARYSFLAGDNTIYQTMLVKPFANGASGYPIHRDDWYVRQP